MSFKLKYFGACSLIRHFAINAFLSAGEILLLEPLLQDEEGTGQEEAQTLTNNK